MGTNYFLINHTKKQYISLRSWTHEGDWLLYWLLQSNGLFGGWKNDELQSSGDQDGDYPIHVVRGDSDCYDIPKNTKIPENAYEDVTEQVQKEYEDANRE